MRRIMMAVLLSGLSAGAQAADLRLFTLGEAKELAAQDKEPVAGAEAPLSVAGLGQKYGVTFVEPRQLVRCPCVQLGVEKGGAYIGEIRSIHPAPRTGPVPALLDVQDPLVVQELEGSLRRLLGIESGMTPTVERKLGQWTEECLRAGAADLQKCLDEKIAQAPEEPAGIGDAFQRAIEEMMRQIQEQVRRRIRECGIPFPPEPCDETCQKQYLAQHGPAIEACLKKPEGDSAP